MFGFHTHTRLCLISLKDPSRVLQLVSEPRNQNLGSVDIIRFKKVFVLLNLDRENLEVLARHQIKATEKYEPIAKGWTRAVAEVIRLSKNVKSTLGGSGSSAGR